ncbi:hypothetical protein C7I85_24015 [Mesorhizobium soli]|uniref:Uncharacterized protein n=1 Tax=Pseudaminobacter soli (ex Li et al. 2025) TaxID=1295366 RepID=A0A2P7S2E0_9HYPH|nr:hypothetical protein C7I85_24015 [Mesorhizobium soli]
MLDITQDFTEWPEDLAPQGFGTCDRERFPQWWARNQTRLAHLHPQIAEQWVYRHWKHSPYAWLSLDSLSWRQERWDTNRILSQVFVRDSHLDPHHDFKVFNKFAAKSPPVSVMNQTGTWDYPILTLETPQGIRAHRAALPEKRFLLIEGHSRYRYLNALAARGQTGASHELFIMSTPRAEHGEDDHTGT